MKNGLRKRLARLMFIALVLSSSASMRVAGGQASAGPSFLYKAVFVRAAPGKLLDLIDLYKSRLAVFDAAGDERPLWWRHTEGDQWDLMLLFPMRSYTEYHSKERVSRREKAEAASPSPQKEFRQKLNACTAWTEDVFVMGPPLETVAKEFNSAGFYHLEIFVALPGKQEDLYEEREMENAYQLGIGRPATMIFVRDEGAAWDMFSLGCYRDIKHWSGTSDIPKEQRDADAIGPTMRTFIAMHRDTMGVPIK